MAISKHVTGENGSAIWAETANINYFLANDLEPAAIGAVEVRTKNVPAKKVRRYAGDPAPYSVGSQGNVRYLYDPGRRNGGGTPGQPFGLDDGTEKRFFTFEGSWVDIHAFLLGNLENECTVYSPSATTVITPLEAGRKKGLGG